MRTPEDKVEDMTGRGLTLIQIRAVATARNDMELHKHVLELLKKEEGVA